MPAPFSSHAIRFAAVWSQSPYYLVNGFYGQVTTAAYSPAGQGRISCVISDAVQAGP